VTEFYLRCTATDIDFCRCSDSAPFNVSLVFSANNGGNVIETNETKQRFGILTE
jgi:hypothetical protein